MIGRYTIRAVNLGIIIVYIIISIVPNPSQKYGNGYRSIMPLGDPHGGEFEYTDEGLPESIAAFTVPCRDLDRSIGFYSSILRMGLLGRTGDTAYLRRSACTVILKISDSTGVDTGVYLGVGSPYDTHRRLIDEGVGFYDEPRRGPLGTSTAITDPDGNIVRMIDTGAEFRLRTTGGCPTSGRPR